VFEAGSPVGWVEVRSGEAQRNGRPLLGFAALNASLRRVRSLDFIRVASGVSDAGSPVGWVETRSGEAQRNGRTLLGFAALNANLRLGASPGCKACSA